MSPRGPWSRGGGWVRDGACPRCDPPPLPSPPHRGGVSEDVPAGAPHHHVRALRLRGGAAGRAAPRAPAAGLGVSCLEGETSTDWEGGGSPVWTGRGQGTPPVWTGMGGDPQYRLRWRRRPPVWSGGVGLILTSALALSGGPILGGGGVSLSPVPPQSSSFRSQFPPFPSQLPPHLFSISTPVPPLFPPFPPVPFPVSPSPPLNWLPVTATGAAIAAPTFTSWPRGSSFTSSPASSSSCTSRTAASATTCATATACAGETGRGPAPPPKFIPVCPGSLRLPLLPSPLPPLLPPP